MVDSGHDLHRFVHILQRHSFRDDHGKGPHAVLIHHDILAVYGFQRFGQITQQVIVDFCDGQSDEGRDDEKDARDQYQYSVFGNPFSDAHGKSDSLSVNAVYPDDYSKRINKFVWHL